jgi:two-component system CheB/CheR fusion protein
MHPTPATHRRAHRPSPQGPGASLGFPVVGLGASAGGLAAFEAFFSGLPATGNPGMAFLLVQHLAPDHESLLPDLIRRVTRLPVFVVEDGMPIQPNSVYILPPGHDMGLLDGALHLMDPAEPPGQRRPIDFLFRSLAADQHDRAIAIVLSGTGADGSEGVRAIRAEGGLVVAQSPASAEFDGMPRSALGTGLVDFELQPAEMAPRLMAFLARGPERPEDASAGPTPEDPRALARLLFILRTRTGHAFSQYKQSTVLRRVERRQTLQGFTSLAEYTAFLERTPEEAEALFHDLLIGVTKFFRDPASFAALEAQAIPALLARATKEVPVRVWCAGCSTGEEAYTLAILLQEGLARLEAPPAVQIFATDIDARAIATARAGLYAESIAADLTPERLARCFTREPGGGYRVSRSLRNMIVFSEQDLIKDPPFSKLDLISCRNLLIYLSSELQRRIIPLFHYALNPGGFLFQGNSESVGGADQIFSPLDRKANLYQRLEPPPGRRAPSPPAIPLAPGGSREPDRPAPPVAPPQPSLRKITEQALLDRGGACAVLVNRKGRVLYLHGRSGAYLEPPSGEAGVSNILRMAREGLRRELTTALHQAAAGHERVRFPGLNLRSTGLVDLSVEPLDTGSGTEGPLFLVVLEPAAPPPSEDSDHPPAPTGAPEARELQAKGAYLEASNAELETVNEALEESNGEMRSLNEELQATNEELQTSKEELQSVNEELSTVNTELQTKVVDLTRAYNDMSNLMASTDVGTLFVDHALNILRFTPAATRILPLIPGDIGRPVGHLTSSLVDYDTLTADLQQVLDTLQPVEVETRSREGRWYRLRIQPYRTLDNVIEGAVITFLEITERKAALAQHAADRQTLFDLTEGLAQMAWIADPEGTFTFQGVRWCAFTGADPEPGIAVKWQAYVHPEDLPGVLRRWEEARTRATPFTLHCRLRHRTGTYRWVETRLRDLGKPGGPLRGWLGLGEEMPPAALRTPPIIASATPVPPRETPHDPSR